MTFDYNFDICKICNSNVVWNYNHGNIGTCPNGCCTYDVDPQGETVGIFLFSDNVYDLDADEDKTFLVPLQENRRRTNIFGEPSEYLWEDIERFLKAVDYWKENDRYLAEILSSK